MHDMTGQQVVSSSRVLVDRASTAVMGGIDSCVRLTSVDKVDMLIKLHKVDMIDFCQFLAFLHCAYAFPGFFLVRPGQADARHQWSSLPGWLLQLQDGPFRCWMPWPRIQSLDLAGSGWMVLAMGKL